MATAQEEFVESLKRKLIASGEKNVVLVEPGKANRDKAMENIAEAFSDPVKDFIDKESSGTSVAASITSRDQSVSVAETRNPSTGASVTDLSVAKTVSNSVKTHNQSSSSHPDIRDTVAGVNTALEAHKADHDNPHQVTAHQTGAYTQQETDDRVLRMQYRGGGRLKFWRGNPLPTM